MFTFWYIVFVSMLTPATCSVSANLQELATAWAPKVWIASGESYYPSSVEYFFDNTYLKNDPSLDVDTDNIPICSSGCYLVTSETLDEPSSTLSFFSGQSPSLSPVYTVIRRQKVLSVTITEIYYWLFYPYNLGKSVSSTVFGNHVGDWEHVKVTLYGNTAKTIQLSAHGITHTFQRSGNVFKNSDGQADIQLVDGTHPIVYSAYGSHGLWSSAGTHVYKTILNTVELKDECSEGKGWLTWNNMKIDMYDSTGQYESSPIGFFRYLGRWGNEESGCVDLIGECVLSKGPKGPNKVF